MVSALSLAAASLLLEAATGYPRGLFRRIRHPVVWIGVLLDGLERRYNRPSATRATGARVLAVLVLLVALVTVVFATAARTLGPAGFVLEAIVASSLLAQRSLHQHVAAVACAIDHSLAEARHAVSQIVGRDPETLDEPAIARAAIESLAENFADGVTAPAFWCALAGLPGIALYKAINTADSMIGHHTPRYERFGWAAARLDDWVNLPASRLAALFLTLAAVLLPGADARAACLAVLRDAGNHRSPNAGWPEAAMAGALGLRLAGPRTYGGERVLDAWMGDGRTDATAGDIHRALRLYRLACALQIATVTELAVIALG